MDTPGQKITNMKAEAVSKTGDAGNEAATSSSSAAMAPPLSADRTSTIARSSNASSTDTTSTADTLSASEAQELAAQSSSPRPSGFPGRDRFLLTWVCCVCGVWTNHPIDTCNRLIGGMELVDRSWVACRHEKCEVCIDLTEMKWQERFPWQ